MKKVLGVAPRHPGLWKNPAFSKTPAEVIHTLKSRDHGLNELRAHAAVLAQLSQQGRWIVLINAPNIGYKQVLANAGVRMDRVLLVRARDEVEALWAMEKALTSGTSSAVVTWSTPLDDRDNRRLQLVAKSARATGWLIENVSVHKHEEVENNYRLPLLPATNLPAVH